MVKQYLALALCLFIVSCATQQLTIIPAEHIQSILPKTAFDSLEMVGDEVWLRKQGELVGTYQAIQKQDKFESATEEVKAGYAMMKETGAVEVDIGETKYAFYVKSDNFTTYYVTDKNNTKYWSMISIKTALVDNMTIR